MANFTDRLKENVPGKFYVDSSCLDCDLCRDTAPEIFKRSDENGYFYVYRQPVTDEEIAKTIEAIEGCPCESIGADGDKGDWDGPINPPGVTTVGEKRTCGCKHTGSCDTKQPWWKFWR